MNIEEVKDLKVKLGSDIAELIKDYENTTGCSVDSVNISKQFSMGGEPVTLSTLVSVSI